MWTSDVKLILLGGMIDCAVSSVPVPPLASEETGCLSVDLIAPAEPGMMMWLVVA